MIWFKNISHVYKSARLFWCGSVAGQQRLHEGPDEGTMPSAHHFVPQMRLDINLTEQRKEIFLCARIIIIGRTVATGLKNVCLDPRMQQCMF